VVAFHGLEPIFHRELLAEAAARGERLSWRYRALQEWLMPLMLGIVCRRAAAVICLNAEEVELVVGRGWARRERVALIPHGVGGTFFAPPRQVAAVRQLLFVGQWIPIKGIRYLVDAVDALMARHPGLALVCAGTGKDAETVLAAFPPSIRDRVSVYPRVDHVELAALYRAADAFVFPSLFEGFSRAVVEAMAGGLPIVATPIAADVLRDGDNALIVPRRDAAAVVTAVERLIADPALATRLGAAAAHSAQDLHAPDRLRQVADLLISVARTSTVS
jgi:glycosyltransferase involved in cell wall biosynthesis